MAQFSEQLADLSERTRCADGGVLNMHVVIFVTVIAIVVGFAVPTYADDRPSDPFGNQTIELNKETPLVEMWESLRVRFETHADRARRRTRSMTEAA